jgi:hypothetical protein
MPFKSKQQMKYMFATNPKVAAKMEDKTKSLKKLPKKVSKGAKAFIKRVTGKSLTVTKKKTVKKKK